MLLPPPPQETMREDSNAVDHPMPPPTPMKALGYSRMSRPVGSLESSTTTAVLADELEMSIGARTRSPRPFPTVTEPAPATLTVALVGAEPVPMDTLV